MKKTFQFTLPCRERPEPPAEPKPAAAFQFTLPCRERLRRCRTTATSAMFQFTLPCRERHGERDAPTLGKRVSIHAPV